MDAEEILASGDKTVARVKASGTQNGEFMGIPASGKSVEVQLIDIMRFDEAGGVRALGRHGHAVDAPATRSDSGRPTGVSDTAAST